MDKKQPNDAKTNPPPVKGTSVSYIPTVDEAEALAQSGGVLGELLKRCGGVLIAITKPPPTDNN